MKKGFKIFLIIVGAVVLILLALFIYGGMRGRLPGSAGEVVIAEASYSCAQGRGIRAAFRQNGVDLVLSDGRRVSLPQTIAASGARYAHPDESFIFWTKEDGASIEERGRQTYADCAIPAKL